MVTEIGLNKAGPILGHESFTVWIVNEDDSEEYTFVIDRSPFNNLHSSFSCGCPEGRAVLESIQKAIQNMQSTGTGRDSNLESIALLPLSTTLPELSDFKLPDSELSDSE